MALLDPTDHSPMTDRASGQQPTTKPRLCLVGGFGFMVAVGLVVHFAFNALI